MGIFGGIFYLLFFLYPIYFSLKNQNEFSFCVILIALGVIIQNSFDSPFSFIEIFVTYLLSISVLMALSIRSKKEKNEHII